MNESVQLVVFVLDGQHYGLRLSVVERITRAVEVTPLPAAPQIILGVMNLAGYVVAIVDIRKRFGLPRKDIDLDDGFIVARTTRRRVVLVADSVPSIIEVPAGKVVRAPEIVPGIQHVEGVAKLEDGMVLIQDLDKFLSLEEESALDHLIPDERGSL